MRFFGGLNRAHSLFFRYRPHTLAVMELGQDEVSISLGGRFNFLFDGPFIWKTSELEFNRQPRRINSYVGLRTRGKDEWTWFHTGSLKALCAGLASVGATEVAAPPLQTKDILLITLPGSVLVAGVGLILVAVAQLLRAQDLAEAQTLGGGLQVVGLVPLIFGVAFCGIHLWGRRRSGVPR